MSREFSCDHILSSRCRISGIVGDETYAERHAAEIGERISLSLSIPRRSGVTECNLRVYNETEQRRIDYPLSWHSFKGANDTYSIDLDTKEIGVGLCFLSFVCETPIGRVYSSRVSSDTFCFSQNDDGSSFQLLISEFAYPAPTSQYGGIVYQIFVDRFAKGKDRPVPCGMELVSDWNELRLEFPAYPGAPMKNNIVYGGNLDGIRSRLDYLASLGVTLIYLTPIFSSPSNHKYDTADYEVIDPLFGDEEDLRRLVTEAGKLGIGILLDGVFNHTGSDSVYFNSKGRFPSIGACQSKDSPYYPWYRFREYPSSYECWWDIEILPRIHPSEPSCSSFFVGPGGVIDRWASFGIAGMRLDVADELPDEFIAEIKSRLSMANAQSLLYGEVWEDASNKIAYDQRKRYYHGKELDGVMNYPLRNAVLSFLRDGDVSPMRYYIDEIMPNTPRRVLHAQLNLIGTHDTPRAITALAGESPDRYTNAELFSMTLSDEQRALGRKRMKQAMAILSFMPGLPMIYYGDEVGMQGYSDPFNRLPFPWGREDTELLECYREIGAWRRRMKALRYGSFSAKHVDPNLLIFERFDDSERLVLIINRGDSTFKAKQNGKIGNLIGGRMEKQAVIVDPCGFAAFSVSTF